MPSKGEGQPSKKEVSWVLDICINKNIYVYILFDLRSWRVWSLVLGVPKKMVKSWVYES